MNSQIHLIKIFSIQRYSLNRKNPKVL